MVTPDDQRAQATLRRAFAASYRLPAHFPGFSARLSFTSGSGSRDGELSVRSPGQIELDIDLSPDELAWLRRESTSMAAHLWHRDLDAVAGESRVSVLEEQEGPLGRAIVSIHEGCKTIYRIRNDEIVEVVRHGEHQRVAILVQARVNLADGRSLPSYFTTFFWDDEARRLVGTTVYEDRFTEVEGVYLPAARLAVSADDRGTCARLIEIREHRILDDNPGATAMNGRQNF